jgi:hypothetical protein
MITLRTRNGDSIQSEDFDLPPGGYLESELCARLGVTPGWELFRLLYDDSLIDAPLDPNSPNEIWVRSGDTFLKRRAE